MLTKIYVPDVLPNNLRAIREFWGYTVKDVAEGIKVDRNFLSAVEQENKNFSGKTTIRAFKYYNINFYKAYDVMEKRFLNATDKFPHLISKSITLGLDDIESSFFNIDKKMLLNNQKFKQILEGIIEENCSMGTFSDIAIRDKHLDNNNVLLDIDFIFLKRETRLMEFDINFTEKEDTVLTNILIYKGFMETIVTWEQLIDDENVRIEGDRLYLDMDFKIPKGNDINEFYTTNVLNINEVELKTVKDPVRKKEFKYAKFKAIRPEINNIKFLRSFKNFSIEDMQNALGLSYNVYLNMELGNQKVSTKSAWRLVELFKVPLEYILNIDEYYIRFCKYDLSNDTE